MSTATPMDVRGVIATSLSDSEIQSYLDDAAFDAEQEIPDYSSALSSSEKTQLEKYYAALLIRRLRDKPVQNTSRESASVSFEGDAPTLGELQAMVDRRDPSGELAYNVDASRYVNSGSV